MLQSNPDQVLDALSDPTRRAVVELLCQRPHRAGELARATGSDPARMSRHLRVLLKAGVAEDERSAQDARVRIFRLRGTALAPLTDWLQQLQEHWDAQLASFKAHVDARLADQQTEQETEQGEEGP